MDVESLAKELILKNMTPEQQMAVLDSVKQSVADAREVQKRKIGENVDLVVQALKKIESDIRDRFDSVGNAIEKRVLSIQDGRDGVDGKDGRDGKDGKAGRDGIKGDKGNDGRDGRDGVDGVNGVSVTDARIDFDGSLVITLSTGVELNVGEVVAPDLAESIKVITNGGGTSQSVIDTLASLQTQITNLIPSQTGNSGKYLTTNGTALSWGSPASAGFSNTAAAGTTTVLTSSSVKNYVVTGSGGQTFQLPNATTLTSGDIYTFNNNQSSGTIVVKNNSSTTVTTIQSGGYVSVVLLSNATAAGSWDVHNFAPSNVSWSTNTFDYAGSITSATWNGTSVAYNRGGTGQSSAFVVGGIVYGSTTSALAVTGIGTSGQVLTSAGAGTPTWTTPTTGTVTSVSGTGTVSGLTLSGTVTSSGNITLGGSITGFATSGANTNLTSVALTTGTVSTAPSSSTDIVNKSYADSIATGVNFHAAVQYATTAALAANTYNNGTSGVGATLTANANGTLTIDGYTLVVGDVGKRLLIKNESTTANNGVYTLTQAGTVLLPYILTRATDYDSSGSGTNEVDQGDLILVINGTQNANTSWVEQTPLPITIGTTAIVFIQFAAIQTYTAGTGLSLSTNQFSLASSYGDTLNPYASKTLKYVLAAPNGADGVPTFRALVASDIPTLNQSTTGSAATLTTPRAIYGNNFDGSAALTQIIASTYGGTGNGFTKFSGATTAERTYTLPDATTTILTTNAAVTIGQGGTGQTSYTDGQLLIGNTTGNTLTKATLTAGTGITITNGNGSISIAASGGSGVTSVTGTSPVVSSGGTTPAISLASGYGDTLNPYASKTANYFLSAPNGSAGVPTFRAIVAADIPTLNQNTTGTAGSLSTASGSAPSYSARAWVNFNGTGTVAIRSSGNVSSITDNGVGDYTVNFSTAMSDGNYSTVALSSTKSGVEGQSLIIIEWTTVPSTTVVRITTVARGTGSAQDNTYNNVAVFR